MKNEVEQMEFESWLYNPKVDGLKEEYIEFLESFVLFWETNLKNISSYTSMSVKMAKEVLMDLKSNRYILYLPRDVLKYIKEQND